MKGKNMNKFEFEMAMMNLKIIMPKCEFAINSHSKIDMCNSFKIMTRYVSDLIKAYESEVTDDES
jgi:hypothetical protein